MFAALTLFFCGSNKTMLGLIYHISRLKRLEHVSRLGKISWKHADDYPYRSSAAI